MSTNKKFVAIFVLLVISPYFIYYYLSKYQDNNPSLLLLLIPAIASAYIFVNSENLKRYWRWLGLIFAVISISLFLIMAFLFGLSDLFNFI